MTLLLCKKKQLPFAFTQSKLCTVSFLVQKKDHCSQSCSAHILNVAQNIKTEEPFAPLLLWADVGVKEATILTTSTPELILNVFIMCCWFNLSLCWSTSQSLSNFNTNEASVWKPWIFHSKWNRRIRFTDCSSLYLKRWRWCLVLWKAQWQTVSP